MINFFVKLFRDPLSTAAGLGAAVPIVGAAAGLLQTGLGIAQNIKNKKIQQGLLAQRQAYKTPDQIYQIVNATENMAGGDTQTRDFQTGQLDNLFSESLGSATRLGADSNYLSNLFRMKANAQFQIGEEFHLSNTQYFSDLVAGFKLLADNKAAEYQSKQDILKDKLAAAGVNLNTANQNISGGVNNVLNSLSSKALMDLYKQQQVKDTTVGLNPNTTAIGQQVSSTNASAINTTPTYIDPFTPNLTPNYVNPFG
jgi:hypothetical protein